MIYVHLGHIVILLVHAHNNRMTASHLHILLAAKREQGVYILG